jgi:hypothetical protein
VVNNQWKIVWINDQQPIIKLNPKYALTILRHGTQDIAASSAAADKISY